MISPLFSFVVAGILFYACFTDILSFRIPNLASIAIAGLFPLFALISRMPLHDALMHVLAGCAVLATTFVLYAIGLRFGGGDAKLLSAVALWCGFADLFPLLVAVSAVGGILALAVLLCHRWGIATWASAHGWSLPLFQRQNNHAYIPYAVAIAVGYLVVSI